MAPGITSDIPIHSPPSGKGGASYPEPLKLSGALEQFSYEDATPVIGREFHNVNIVDDLMNSPNADELLRDLAITSAVAPPVWLPIGTESTNLLIQSPNGAWLFSAPKTT